jgi:hypothetical protein
MPNRRLPISYSTLAPASRAEKAKIALKAGSTGALEKARFGCGLYSSRKKSGFWVAQRFSAAVSAAFSSTTSAAEVTEMTFSAAC